LRRALDHAEKAGAGTRALIIFVFNRVSQALHVRNGLFPRFPLYMMSAARETLARSALLGRGDLLRIEPASANVEQLARIDASALGVSREKHHRYLQSDPSIKCSLLYASDECIGYAYVNGDGHIGPVATVSPEFAGTAFTAALDLALEAGAPSVSAFIPGSGEGTLQIAVANGMRITFPMLLVSSENFGDWRRYLPRTGGQPSRVAAPWSAQTSLAPAI
jgi:hypothetical protein